jgi:peptidoglycan/LPS O-acetylase OafA/YrhL
MDRIYFKNLNGLRFIAASMVLISHIEQIKDLRGSKSIYKNGFFSNIGTLGVVLFFVLSGFLITYLLLIEKQNSISKKISIKNFYIRRILRIWPLYFLMLLFGLFLMPKFGFYEFNKFETFEYHNYKIIIPLFLIFLPNVVLVLFGGLPFLHQTWSIGTEEQFYLIWPLIIQKTSNLLKIIFQIMLIYFVIKLLLFSLKSNSIIHNIYSIWSTFHLISLSVGALCAYFYHNHYSEIKRFIYAKLFNIFIFIAFILLCTLSNYLPSFIKYETFSLFFGYLILYLVINESVSYIFESITLRYLGKISYGIYMWHPIAITLAFYFLGSATINNFYLYSITYLLTILIATLSYELIEKKFLLIKEKYK